MSGEIDTQAWIEAGLKEFCGKAAISQATYFNWKRKYNGLLPTEMRRLKQLEDEKLRKVVADLSLEVREHVDSYSDATLRVVVGDRQAIVLHKEIPGMGRVKRYIITIADDDRRPLDKLCQKLIAAAFTCDVLRKQ